MSGASALAAAKRRRAVPAETPIRSKEVPRLQTSNSSVTQSNQNQTNQNQTNQTTTSAQNPLQLLLQHEQKINELQTTFSKINLDKSNPLTPDTLDYFKTQHEHMNREINELKKILIKVQTFSMETNLELLKMKKQKNEVKNEVKIESKNETKNETKHESNESKNETNETKNETKKTKNETIDSRFVYNPSIPELNPIEENSIEENSIEENEISNGFNLGGENIL